jgi:hypothetical protein
MILKTTKHGKGRASHYHVVYLRPDGSGISSVDNKHTHQVDINGIVLEANGHTHELVEIELTETTRQDEQDTTNMVMNLFAEAVDRESDTRRKARESEEFYEGKQWEDDKRRALKNQKRAALEINEIAPKCDILSGFQRQNRTDFKFYPVEGGDARVADMLTEVVKNITEQNDFGFEETDVFEDMMRVGRGFFNTYTDYETNLEGDIKIEHFNWNDVYLGPHAKKDGSDLEHLHKAKWWSWGKVKNTWPNKVDEIKGKVGPLDPEKVERPETLKGFTVGNYINFDTKVAGGMDKELVDIAKKEFRVVETQLKEYERVTVLLSIVDGFFQNTVGWSSNDVAKVRTIPELQKVKRRVTRIRVITTVGGILVEDDYPELPVMDFFLVPVYAKKVGENWYGLIENAKDPQRYVNKQHSQLMDITNRMVSYGWFYDGQTFQSPKAIEEFRKNSGVAGFVQEVGNLQNMPQRVEGPKFPNELANAIMLNKENIRQIMNVNLELAGQSQRAESGIAIDKKQRQALMGNEFLFDNHSRAKKKLGKLLVAQIQDVYTPERILRILENRNMREAFEVGGQPFNEVAPQATPDMPPEMQQEAQQRRQDILELLETEDLTKYDVAISEAAENPTVRHATFLQYKELAQAGLPVPMEMLIDLSDVPNKDKVIQLVQQQQQQAAQQEQAKIDAEIQKTMIAKSGSGQTQ